MSTKSTAPFKSQLTSHFEVILTLRRRRRTWREIAEELEKLGGMKTSASAVFQFFKRHSRRPVALGMEAIRPATPTPPAPARLAQARKPMPVVPAKPKAAFSFDPQTSDVRD